MGFDCCGQRIVDDFMNHENKSMRSAIFCVRETYNLSEDSFECVQTQDSSAHYIAWMIVCTIVSSNFNTKHSIITSN